MIFDPLDKHTLSLDLSAHRLRFDLQAAKDLGDRILALTQNTEQDVLGLDHSAAQLTRLVTGKKQSASSLLVVLLEHVSCDPESGSENEPKP